MTRRTGRALWLRIFCAALLLSLGLAHKPVIAQPLSNPASSFYALPDGTFATICYDGVEGHKPAKSGWFGCEVCRIGADVLLPAPSADHAIVRRISDAFATPGQAASIATSIERPGSPVRGPPAAFA